MALYTSNRDFTLRTTKGVAIAFKKGEPKNVPDHVVTDVVNAGCVPVESEVKPVEAEVVKPKRGRSKKNDASTGTDT